jgi:glycosyltransferase involved in cell wall biosynthesis
MILMSIIMIASYAIVLIWFASGYKKSPSFVGVKTLPKINFSIVIPFRNEAKRLAPLLVSLNELDYPLDKFELIFIDDQSTDQGQQIIQDALGDSGIDFKIIGNHRQTTAPKKDAITLGISSSKFEWILTTDADCALPQQWLTIYNQLIAKQNPAMVMGPVYFGLGTSPWLLSNLIQTEANALQITAIGALGNKKPMLANGANLGYKKTWFIQNEGFKGNDHIASGDDVFMLQKAIDTKAVIAYAKTSEAVVYTHKASTWKEYFWQRIRWASKTNRVPNNLAKITGLLIALANIWWVLLGIAFIVYGELYSFWIAYVAVKMLLDYLFLRLGKSLFYENCTRLFLITSVVYPMASSLVLFGTKLGGYRWKNRRFKK